MVTIVYSKAAFAQAEQTTDHGADRHRAVHGSQHTETLGLPTSWTKTTTLSHLQGEKLMLWNHITPTVLLIRATATLYSGIFVAGDPIIQSLHCSPGSQSYQLPQELLMVNRGPTVGQHQHRHSAERLQHFSHHKRAPWAMPIAESNHSRFLTPKVPHWVSQAWFKPHKMPWKERKFCWWICSFWQMQARSSFYGGDVRCHFTLNLFLRKMGGFTK